MKLRTYIQLVKKEFVKLQKASISEDGHFICIVSLQKLAEISRKTQNTKLRRVYVQHHEHLKVLVAVRTAPYHTAATYCADLGANQIQGRIHLLNSILEEEKLD